MPQIPYTPYPTVRPIEGTGTRGLNIRANEEMFGAQVGQAISHLGRTTEGAGEELFNRAMALKDLDVRNDATMAAADFADAGAEMHQGIKSLQGKQAVDRNATFPTELEARRQEIRGKLKSPMAQRLYDAETRGIYNRNVWSAADWAGTQQRIYTDGADKAEILTAQKQAGVNPASETELNTQLAKIEERIRARNEGKWDEAQTKHDIFEAQSGAISNALVQQSKVDPWTATHRLRSMSARLTQDDINRTTNQVDTNRRTIGARMQTTRIFSGQDTRIGDQIIPIDQAKVAVGTFESGNNYRQQGQMTRHGRALGRYQVMEEFLPDYLRQAGMKQMSKEEFLANPAAQDELFEKTFGANMQKYGSFNEAVSRWFTGKDLATAKAELRTDANKTDINKYLANTSVNLAKVLPERVLQKAAETAANELVSPDEDPLYAPAVANSVHSKFVQLGNERREARVDNINTVLTALTKAGPDGKFVQSKEDLFADPMVSAAYMNLGPKERAAVDNHLIANVNRGYALTPEKQSEFWRLKGMLNSPEGREEFVNMDLSEKKLPNNMYQVLLGAQNDIKRHAEIDPRMTGLLQEPIVQAKMRSLSLMRDQNKDEHDIFTAVLQNMINTAQSTQKTPLTRKDMIEVFNDAVNQQIEDGFVRRFTKGLGGLIGKDITTGGFETGEPYYRLGPAGPEEERMLKDLYDTPGFSEKPEFEQLSIINELRYRSLLQKRRAAKQATTVRAGQ